MISSASYSRKKMSEKEEKEKEKGKEGTYDRM